MPNAVVVELDRELRLPDSQDVQEPILAVEGLDLRQRLLHAPEHDPPVLALEPHGNEARAGLELDLLERERRAEDERGAEHRVTGERHLDRRREDPDPRVPVALGLVDEHGLGEVHLPRDRLQLVLGNLACVREHGHLVALQRGVREDVGDDVAKAAQRDVLGEHPAMPFAIFGPVVPDADYLIGRLRQDRGARLSGPREVQVDVVHLDEHAVDHVRHLGHLPRLGRELAQALRAHVVGRRRREHDRPGSRLELRMRHGPVVVRESRLLAESEGARQPVDRGGAVFIGQHRDHGHAARLSSAAVRLYLVRHAEAAPGEPDELRRLTQQGREQARALGRKLDADGARPGAILTSPLLRARETGGELARALDVATRARRPARARRDSRRRPSRDRWPRRRGRRRRPPAGLRPDRRRPNRRSRACVPRRRALRRRARIAARRPRGDARPRRTSRAPTLMKSSP